ncbi:hypothetical protein PENSPDRAFT_662849 [Peniophora sp. CONT]|nr:hypothetical protein PENSPDRAFT_662849 [Peniophora sp. CONT]
MSRDAKAPARQARRCNEYDKVNIRRATVKSTAGQARSDALTPASLSADFKRHTRAPARGSPPPCAAARLRSPPTPQPLVRPTRSFCSLLYKSSFSVSVTLYQRPVGDRPKKSEGEGRPVYSHGVTQAIGQRRTPSTSAAGGVLPLRDRLGSARRSKATTHPDRAGRTNCRKIAVAASDVAYYVRVDADSIGSTRDIIYKYFEIALGIGPGLVEDRVGRVVGEGGGRWVGAGALRAVIVFRARSNVSSALQPSFSSIQMAYRVLDS